jgi:hypothetical protein
VNLVPNLGLITKDASPSLAPTSQPTVQGVMWPLPVACGRRARLQAFC